MIVIETHELRKEYGSVVAVDSLTLSVKQGEVFGFLGPNGAGKTTSVKMLLGLVYATRGEASVLGSVPGDPAMMARIGFLPEHFRFHPWLKAADFLNIHARLLGMPAEKRRQQIPMLLERVGLGEHATVRLGKFSKGMSQRIGIAQALLNEPDIVFLDEPTSGLDPLGRRLVRDIISELRASGTTVFINSHFLSEVELTCDRVAIISKGQVVRQGAIEELTGGLLVVRIKAVGLTTIVMDGLHRWGTVVSKQGEALIMEVEHEEYLPVMVDWMVNCGVHLFEFSPQRLSLEELFVRVLEDEL